MSGVGYYYTEAKGIELILTNGQGRCYPWHMHTQHWTLGVVRHGAAFLATKAATQTFCQGQYFFIRPYEPHSLNVEPGSSLCVICFEEQANSLFKDASEPFSSYAPYLHTKEEKLLNDVFAACKGVGALETCSPQFSIDHIPLANCAIQQVMRSILENPDEPLSVEQMAAHAGYSQWHFLRTFQSIVGMTPHAFQLLCRLRRVRSLLRADTAASIAAVCAGFSDQSHMHKVFKCHHGMPPGEFKLASVRLEL